MYPPNLPENVHAIRFKTDAGEVVVLVRSIRGGDYQYLKIATRKAQLQVMKEGSTATPREIVSPYSEFSDPWVLIPRTVPEPTVAAALVVGAIALRALQWFKRKKGGRCSR